jgi:hypothetical protein
MDSILGGAWDLQFGTLKDFVKLGLFTMSDVTAMTIV